MKQFAYIIMGQNLKPDENKAEFTTGIIKYNFYTVKNFEESKNLVLDLFNNNDNIAIELCGAFGCDRARELMELTKYKISISYAIHEPEMEELNTKFFNV